MRKAFSGDGCEFVVARNGTLGEGLTFPSMLAQVRSLDPDEVTFYAHAKGVKYEPAIPWPVRRWAEIQYRAALDHWPSVRAQLQRFAMAGSFKMLGRFRAHHCVGDWHYSGTFFWLRHVFVFAHGALELCRASTDVSKRGRASIFSERRQAACLWMACGSFLTMKISGKGVRMPRSRWESDHPPVAPPSSLLAPPPFEGYATPRMEQQPEEFAWLLDQLVAASPRHVLTIGSLHGGVEWHIARPVSDARPRHPHHSGRYTRAPRATRDLRRGPAVLRPAHRTGDRRFHGGRNTSAPHRAIRSCFYRWRTQLSRCPRRRRIRTETRAAADCLARYCRLRLACAGPVRRLACLGGDSARRHSTDERVVGEWGGIGIVRL